MYFSWRFSTQKRRSKHNLERLSDVVILNFVSILESFKERYLIGVF